MLRLARLRVFVAPLLLLACLPLAAQQDMRVHLTRSPDNPNERDSIAITAHVQGPDALVVGYDWVVNGSPRQAGPVLTLSPPHPARYTVEVQIELQSITGRRVTPKRDQMAFDVAPWVSPQCVCEASFVRPPVPTAGMTARFFADIRNPGLVGTDCEVTLSVDGVRQASETAYVPGERSKRFVIDLRIDPSWGPGFTAKLDDCASLGVEVHEAPSPPAPDPPPPDHPTPPTPPEPPAEPPDPGPPGLGDQNRFQALGAPEDLSLCTFHWEIVQAQVTTSSGTPSPYGQAYQGRWSSECGRFRQLGPVDGHALCTGPVDGGYNTGYLGYSPRESGRLRFEVYGFDFERKRGRRVYEGSANLLGKRLAPGTIGIAECRPRAARFQWRTEDGSLCSAWVYKIPRPDPFGPNRFVTGGVQETECVEGAGPPPVAGPVAAGSTAAGDVRSAVEAAATRSGLLPPGARRVAGDELETALTYFRVQERERPACTFQTDSGTVTGGGCVQFVVHLFDDARSAEEEVAAWAQYWAGLTIGQPSLSALDLSGLAGHAWSQTPQPGARKLMRERLGETTDPKTRRDYECWLVGDAHGAIWAQRNSFATVHGFFPSGASAMRPLAEALRASLASVPGTAFSCEGVAPVVAAPGEPPAPPPAPGGSVTPPESSEAPPATSEPTPPAPPPASAPLRELDYRGTVWPVRLDQGVLEVKNADPARHSWPRDWVVVDRDVTRFDGVGTDQGPVLVYEKAGSWRAVLVDLFTGERRNQQLLEGPASIVEARTHGVIVKSGNRCFDFSWNDLLEVDCQTYRYKY